MPGARSGVPIAADGETRYGWLAGRQRARHRAKANGWQGTLPRVQSAPAPVAVIQARMSSSRLPGKSLADVGGEPMLALVVRRLAAAESLAEMIVATSTEPIDDPVAALAARLRVGVARGPRDDVLTRFAGAVGERSGPVVRITADCPLIDGGIVDATVARLGQRRHVARMAEILDAVRREPSLAHFGGARRG